MRVVLFTDRFPDRTQPFLIDKLVGLRAVGVDAHVLCRRYQPDDWGSFPELACDDELRARVHAIRGDSVWLDAPAALGRLSSDLRSSTRLLGAWLRREGLHAARRALADSWLVALRPDVVHFEFAAHAVGRTSFKEALGCALTISCRGYDMAYAGLDVTGFYDDVWAAADALHCLGADLWRLAQERGCPPSKPLALIPPAVDAAYFDPARERPEPRGESEPFRVLSVGRLHWKKGHVDGLRAVRALLDDGVAIEQRIAGGGPADEELRSCVRALGLERHVTLLGPLSRAEVRRQLAWADALSHPSVSEGFSNAVLEAQAMEVPVVATDAEGLAENVVDGQTGFIVRRRRPEQLAERLGLLARDAHLRRDLGRAARARVQERFSVEGQRRALRTFYEDVVARHRARSARAERVSSST